MGMGLLFLALVPLAFLPSVMSAPDDDPADDPMAGHDPGPSGEASADEASASGDLLGIGDGEDEPQGSGANDSEGEEAVLQPLDEDDTPPDPPQPVDEESIVSPLDEDDSYRGEGPDSGLLPIDDIDSDLQEYWLSPADDGGIDHVVIDSFDPAQDILQVVLDPSLVEGTLDVDVQLSDDGQDSLVFVENQLIAVLKGAVGVSSANIHVHLEKIAA